MQMIGGTPEGVARVCYAKGRPSLVTLTYISSLFVCALLYHRLSSTLVPINADQSSARAPVPAEKGSFRANSDGLVRHAVSTTTKRPEMQFRVHVGFEPRDFPCRDLFYQAGYKFNYSDFYFDHADSYRSAVEMAGVAVESSANEQSWILHEIGKMPGVETICETGFKAGHNTFMWLTASPDVNVYSFETEARYNFTKVLAEFMAGEFPERFQLFLGEPSRTTAQVAASLVNDTKRDVQHIDCDVIYVDSTLDASTVEDVMTNFRRMAKRQNIVIMDTHPKGISSTSSRSSARNLIDQNRDTASESDEAAAKASRRALRVWEHFRREKKIIESFRCHYDSSPGEINARKFQTNGLLIGSFVGTSEGGEEE